MKFVSFSLTVSLSLFIFLSCLFRCFGLNFCFDAWGKVGLASIVDLHMLLGPSINQGD